MVNNKLKALCKVNKKISDIQKLYQIKMNLDDGFTFNFDIPNDEFKWIDSHELGENTLYKSMKLKNYDGDIVKLLLFYGKKDSKVKKHNHEEPHVLICVEGKVNVFVDNDPILLNKGQSIHIDSQVWHSIDFIEASKIIIIYI